MCLFGPYGRVKVHQKHLSFSPRGATLLLSWSVSCRVLPAQKAEGEKGKAVDYFSNGAFWLLGTALDIPHTS